MRRSRQVYNSFVILRFLSPAPVHTTLDMTENMDKSIGQGPHSQGVLSIGTTLIVYWNIILYTYLVRVIEIGRYFSWLLLCDRSCPMQQPAFFLSRVPLLGFGKLLSIKKKCHCRFVVMCVDSTTNCQNNYVTIKVASARHSPIAFFTRHDPHIGTSRYVYITGFFTMKLTSRHAHSYGRTQSGVIQHLAQTGVENDIKSSVVEQPAQSPES